MPEGAPHCSTSRQPASLGGRSESPHLGSVEACHFGTIPGLHRHGTSPQRRGVLTSYVQSDGNAVVLERTCRSRQESLGAKVRLRATTTPAKRATGRPRRIRTADELCIKCCAPGVRTHHQVHVPRRRKPAADGENAGALRCHAAGTGHPRMCPEMKPPDTWAPRQPWRSRPPDWGAESGGGGEGGGGGGGRGGGGGAITLLGRELRGARENAVIRAVLR